MKRFLAFVSLIVFSLSFIPVKAEPAFNIEPNTVRITPPAPKFTDAVRQAELARRRANVVRTMADKSMMILFSAEPKIYAGDVDFLYRQENNLYYLTNLKQNNATLVLLKDGASVREILFLPKRSPAAETWNGKMYSREDATRISGLKTIVDSSELSNFLQSIKEKKIFSAADESFTVTAFPENVYFLLPQGAGDRDGAREFRKESEFSKSLEGYKIENANPIFAPLRLIKSPFETKLLQHAIDITTEAQMRSMAMVSRAAWEYEVQAEVEYTFRRRNADYWGYPSIVGCGPNATTLHYVESQGAIKKGDLLLMDVGAEYDHYTADVTRTYPSNGKFTKQQAEIYQIVFDAQEAAAKSVKPGVSTFGDASRAVDRVVKEGLAKLNLITAPDATYQVLYQGKPITLPQYKLFSLHGFGHWLGMNVHDVGDYGAKLQPGMVFTNEPGIYIRADALDYMADTPENKALLAKIHPVFEKYKNIGVRIEDDLLVTETGVEWMTKNLPRTIPAIEAFMAKASKEMTVSDFGAAPNNHLAFFGDSKFLLTDLSNSGSYLTDKTMIGKTVRRGWISPSKNAAHFDSNHFHAE